MQGATPVTVLDTMLSAIVGAGGALNGSKVILFTAPNVITPDVALGDLTLATFTGYAPSAAVVWGTVFRDDEGLARAVGSLVQFTSTDGAVQETIVGWGLTNGAGSALLYAQLLDVPVPINRGDQAIVIVPEYALGQQPVEGDVIV